ncbi:hypothetical protein D3C75_1005940 [compost metagenome]
MKHDLSLHTEVAAEKNWVRALAREAGQPGAGAWRTIVCLGNAKAMRVKGFMTRT